MTAQVTRIDGRRMARSVTLHDVAVMAGVSAKTVSNVVRGYPGVGPATRDRILDAIRQLDYRPNLAARGLKSGSTGVITLIIPDLRNAYFAELAHSVMEEAAARGLFVTIEQVGFSREQEIQSLRRPRSRLVDGILYSALTLDESDLDLLETRTPLVLLGEQIFHGPVDHVAMKNVEAVRASTSLLLESGRRRIVALGASLRSERGTVALRLQGYREALELAGIAVDEKLLMDPGGWHRGDGQMAVHQLIDANVAFDGIVAFSDTLALGALRALELRGRRVPEDVAIIGFDDIEEAAFSLPALSSVDAGRQEIARTAVELLCERIEQPDSDESPRELYVDFRIVQRESTGPAAAQP
jgi:DNA-binding LacI/PurR family transcriptional regulator